MLVFALDLEDVEEVGGGGVDLDEVLIVLWCGIGDVDDLELLGALCKKCSNQYSVRDDNFKCRIASIFFHVYDFMKLSG